MKRRPSSILAISVVAISLTLGLLAVAIGRTDPGIALEQDGIYVRIASVAPDSPAQLDGFAPGMIVTSINELDLVRLPQYVVPDDVAAPEPPASEIPAPTGSASPPPTISASPGISSTPSASPSGAAASSVASAGAVASSVPPSPDNGGGTIGGGDGTDGSGDVAAILDPPVPVPVAIDRATFDNIENSEIYHLSAITAFNLDHETGAQYLTADLTDSYLPGPPARLSAELAVGCLLLGAAVWLIASGRAGRSLQPLALSLGVATVVPFLAGSLLVTWYGPAVALAGVLLPLGMLPLAYELAQRIPDPEVRRATLLVSGATAVGAAIIGLLRVGIDASNFSADAARYLLVGIIPLVPGVAAARPLGRVATSGLGDSPVRSTELVVAGATPLMSSITMAYLNAALLPLSAWLVVIALASRLTVRPLTRLVSRAQLQRDLVVAATEAERARVAADIHDDALQELTLLVRRLDSTGDAEGAAMGRLVIERLRAICGDLRLPLLDDLGVGPALDWLVKRIEAIAGGEVRLEQSDGVRPPPDVELAFFRVAQEALANAASHGRPPIVVRYQATDAGAQLSVDDAGAGIAPGAADLAEQAGHFGLLNMRQRAEQIGAILDVRPWPGGGTHVSLQWRPH